MNHFGFASVFHARQAVRKVYLMFDYSNIFRELSSKPKVPSKFKCDVINEGNKTSKKIWEIDEICMALLWHDKLSYIRVFFCCIDKAPLELRLP